LIKRMSKRSGEIKVALVGAYPPPYGGVSTHVQRLHELCLENNIRCTVFDVSRYVKKARNVVNLSRPWQWPHLLASRQDIIHVHTTSMHWVIPAIFRILSCIKDAKYVLSYHSLRYSARDFGPLGRRMMKVVLSSAAHCIAVNEEIKEKLITLGAVPERVSVIPSFLPPVKKESEIAAIPREVRDFMDGHKPVISASAFRPVIHEGIDRYGIDMCLELCAELQKVYPLVGLVFCLPDAGDGQYFREMQCRIAEKGMDGNFLFHTRPGQFYPLLMKSDIFVRPTNADSYGISVAEALYFGVPAVASDVCPRPEGAELFKSRDIEDFIARVKTVWDNYGHHKSKIESLEVASGRGGILDIYRNLVDKGAVSSEEA
jgi:glycosyltransferase involved in cell wall biosynthesis